MDRELHRIVTTTVIYRKDGDGFRYLMTKRSPTKKVHPNKWHLVGGGLTIDDYISTPITHGDNAWLNVVEKSQQREVKEEVGVTIGTPVYLFNFAFIRPDNIPVIVMVYYAPYISGEVRLDEDAVDYKWVTMFEAKELDLIPGIYQELVEVDASLSK